MLPGCLLPARPTLQPFCHCFYMNTLCLTPLTTLASAYRLLALQHVNAASSICWLCRHDDSGLAAYLDPRDHRNNSAAMLLQCLQSGVVSPRDTAAAETAEALAGISSRVGAGSQAASTIS